MIVSLDFDGTLVWTPKFPVFDPTPLPGLLEALEWMKENLGAKFILLTQRDHDHVYNRTLGKAVRRREGDNRKTVLQEAIEWCKSQGIELWAVNENPGQTSWSTSRKVYSDIMIDDRNLGIPLDGNSCVDWVEVLRMLKDKYGS